MSPRPTLLVRPNGEMSFYATLQNAAEAMGVTIYNIKTARHDHVQLPGGVRLVDAKGRIEDTIKDVLRLSPHAKVPEGPLPLEARAELTRIMRKSKEGEGGRQEEEGGERLEAGRGSPRKEDVEEEEDLSDFRTQAVLLMMLFSVAGILWPPLRAALTEPSGILATLAVGLAASHLLRRHARRLDDKVTRALRPLVHQYVLHEVSLLLQLLVLGGAMVLCVTSLSAVLALALSAMARAAFFAFGRLRWLVTFWFHGREAADAHVWCGRVGIPPGWKTRDVVHNWLRSLAGEDLLKLMKKREEAEGSMTSDQALAQVYDGAMAALDWLQYTCIKGGSSRTAGQSLHRCLRDALYKAL